MGLFDYFKRRRERESAVESIEITAEPSAQVEPLSASFGDDPEAPPQANLADGLGLAELGQIGKLIAQAANEGNIQVHMGEPQTIDMQGTDLGEEIKGILAQYGVDPQATSAEGIDASQMPQMQQQILDAITRQGLDLGQFFEGGAPPGLDEPDPDAQ